MYAVLTALELICRPVSEIQKELSSRKAAELLSGYGTDEPYALCAAYLLLEREKDALENLNALTAIVMTCAARHLPWTQDDFDARAGLFERGRPDYRLRYEYRGADEDGKIDGDAPPDWLVSGRYIATGVVSPRNQRPSGERMWCGSRSTPCPISIITASLMPPGRTVSRCAILVQPAHRNAPYSWRWTNRAWINFFVTVADELL